MKLFNIIAKTKKQAIKQAGYAEGKNEHVKYVKFNKTLTLKARTAKSDLARLLPGYKIYSVYGTKGK